MMPLALAARTTDPDLGRQPYRSRCRPRCLIRLGVAIWYQSPDLRLARARNREHIDVFHDNNVRRPRLVHSRCTHASPSLKAVSDGWSRLITPGICDWRNRIQGSVCAAAILAAHVRFGSKSRHHALKSPCPLTPKSGHCWPTVECPLCAKSRHMQCSNHVEIAFETSSREFGGCFFSKTSDRLVRV